MKIEQVSTPREKMKDACYGTSYACHVAKSKSNEKGRPAIEGCFNHMPSMLTQALDYAQDITPKQDLFQSLAKQSSRLGI